MSVTTYVGWLITDYVGRIIVLLMMGYLIKRKISSFADFGFTKIKAKPLIFWAILLSVSGVFIDQFGRRFFESILPHTQMMVFYKITNPTIRIIDLTFGLLLVALTEEAVFRGFYNSVLSKWIKNPVAFLIVSSITFGLIHWSLGLHSVITSALWGVLPMIVLWKTQSILPAIIAHYLSNLVAFSKIIPASWFQFMY